MRGRLYDLGSFPALVDAEGWVAGELWYLADNDFEISLRLLDRIEGHYGNPDDLYVRREADCQTETGERTRCYAYYFAHPEDLGADQLIPADDSGRAVWP
jgi:gamma-glutamylcyclotransferase (GGCT)/AIG2-like uncharacterized protein YtfP